MGMCWYNHLFIIIAMFTWSKIKVHLEIEPQVSGPLMVR